MNKLFSISLLAVLLLTRSALMAQSTTATLPSNLSSKIQGNYFVYEGYRFDISQILISEKLEDILHELEWQVYFIEVLNLPQEIQDFFKSIPVLILPSVEPADSPVNQGDYSISAPQSITLRVDVLLTTQWMRTSTLNDISMALYYFLTALLDECLPQGANNPDIVTYFKQAKSLGYYQEKKPSWISGGLSPTDAVRSFFAQSAISYLRGSCWEEPSSCYVIQKNQPEFFHYLENLFGPKSGFLNQCFSYHGFHFNWSQMDDFSDYQEVCNQCMRQVDYIESTGLSQKFMDFFKSIPLTLQPFYEMDMGGAAGAYAQTTKSIALCHDYFFDDQSKGRKDPTLLHECLHAFHDQCLPKGFDNPDIINFFQDAQQHDDYDLPNTWCPDFINYLMTNEGEFFACTASVFLVDFEAFQPFNRDNLFQNQSEYYHYLIKIFGVNPYNLPVEKINSWNIDMLY